MQIKRLAVGVASFGLSCQVLMAAELSLSSFSERARAIGEDVMKNCKESGFIVQPFKRSIQDINLKDGAHLVVFDPASLCDRRFKANGACTTDGCDIFVLQEERDGFLKSVYYQTVTDYDVALETAIRPFRLSVSMRGGVPPCSKQRSDTCSIVLEWAAGKFVEPDAVRSPQWEGLWANNKEQCACRLGVIDLCRAGKGLPPLKIDKKKMVAPELSCDIVKVNRSEVGRFDLIGRCWSEGSEGAARVKGAGEPGRSSPSRSSAPLVSCVPVVLPGAEFDAVMIRSPNTRGRRLRGKTVSATSANHADVNRTPARCTRARRTSSGRSSFSKT